MHEQLLDYLICPTCLPEEHGLQYEIQEQEKTDILQGTLTCPSCAAKFTITDGIGVLTPGFVQNKKRDNKYEHDSVVSSYLWSHYGDLLNDDNWSDAYPNWSKQIQPTSGLGLDLGGAVGRFTFELASKCDFVIGVDNSLAFIQTARKLFRDGNITVRLKEEGEIFREANITLPEEWQKANVEWIVADALRLPFRNNSAAVVTSLNLIDKVSHPLQHLQEMDRVSAVDDAQLLLSDPFSWSEEAAEKDDWLGGKTEGEYTGLGLDNVEKLFTHKNAHCNGLWKSTCKDHVWWKIRTHRNHYELIRSCYLKLTR
jgi:ubiquinone/menaquinone biosynthesis C-methylase UbiE